MAKQGFGLSFVLGGVLSSSFTSSFKKANSSITDIDNNIKMLSKSRVDIKTFRTLSKDATENKDALARLSTTLKRSGIDVNNLTSASRSLTGSLVNLKKASKIELKISGVKNQFSEQKASIVGIGASILALRGIVRSASNSLKAQGEIASLGISESGIDRITSASHKMALQFGQLTAPAMIRASYDIKSGIASLSESGVNDFTKFAATTAVATKSTIGEMTKLYAFGYDIFRQDFGSDVDFGKQFSGAIAGAVQAFRTDGSDLAAGMSSIGKRAQVMGVSLEEQLSIIGLSKGSFASASEAGTSYSAFLDGAGKAQEKLGLTFVDSNGQMLPMVNILSLLKEKYGDLDLAEMDELKGAFGSSEATKIITALLPKINELTEAQGNLRQAMDGGLSKAEQMAKAMDRGYGFEKMGNAMSLFSFTLGKSVAPAVDLFASGLGKMARGLAWLDETIPFLVPTLGGLAFSVMSLVVVLKTATLAKLAFKYVTLNLRKFIVLTTAANFYSALSFGAVGKSSVLARSKLLLFSASSKIATGAMWLFNTAMNANPITKVVTLLTALGTGAVYLYKNFEPFTTFVDSIWSKLKGFFSFVTSGWSAVGGIVSSIGSYLGLGGDESRLKIPSTPKKTAVAFASAAALSSPVAMASQASVEPRAVNQTITMQVTVNNPSSNVDVERAITNAMRDRSAISLTDQDI